MNNGTVTETFDVNATYDGSSDWNANSYCTRSWKYPEFDVQLEHHRRDSSNVHLNSKSSCRSWGRRYIKQRKTATVTVQSSAGAVYDVNGDGTVDMKDIGDRGQSGLEQNVATWPCKLLDVYGPKGVPDGKIDLFDVAAVSQHFRMT